MIVPETRCASCKHLLESESDLATRKMEDLDGSFYLFGEITEQSTIFDDDDSSYEDDHFLDDES